MIEALRKKALKSTLVWSIIMIIAGIAMLVFQGVTAFYAVFGYVDFKTLKPEQIKFQMVDVDLTTNFGYYIEEYEYNTETKYRKTTDLYYVIWTGDEETDEEFRYMGIKVPASYKSKMDDMADAYWEGYYSEPIHFSGQIRKMSSEDYGYFKDYFTGGENGWTDEEFEQATIPYYIQTVVSKPSTNGIALVISIGGIALIVWAIVRICRAATGATLKRFRKAIEAEGCTEATAESDYNAAQSFTKNGDIRIGRLFLYYMQGAVPKALPMNKMEWVYQITTTHRRNGIKTGTSYSIMIYMERGDSLSVTIQVPNEAVSQAILDKINSTYPWVVVGYSEEIKRLFNKDRSQFLSLRYNTVEHIPVDPATASNSVSGGTTT